MYILYMKKQFRFVVPLTSNKILFYNFSESLAKRANDLLRKKREVNYKKSYVIFNCQNILVIHISLYHYS